MFYTATDICQQFLKNVKQTSNNDDGGAQFLASCPCATNHKNGDIHRSLSVGDGRKGTLFCCQTGCTLDDILAAIGIKRRDIHPDKHPTDAGATAHKTVKTKPQHIPEKTSAEPLGKRVCTYKWPLIGGGFANQDKYAYPDGHKSLAWRGGLNGKKTSIYNAESVATAIKQDRFVYICEGAKDCETLIKMGLCATTTGSASSNFEQHHCELLQDATVVVLYDYNFAGMNYARRTVHALRAYAAKISIVHLTDLRWDKDVSDWLVDHDADELLELIFMAQMASTEETLSELDRRIAAAEIKKRDEDAARRSAETKPNADAFTSFCQSRKSYGGAYPSDTTIGVWLEILKFTRRETGTASIGHAQISEILGVKRSQITASVKWLIDAKFMCQVERGRQGKGVSIYKPNVENSDIGK